MTSQNPAENDANLDTTLPAKGDAPKDEKPDKPSDIDRELTDEEIAAVAGGLVSSQVRANGPILNSY